MSRNLTVKFVTHQVHQLGGAQGRAGKVVLAAFFTLGRSARRGEDRGRGGERKTAGGSESGSGAPSPPVRSFPWNEEREEAVLVTSPVSGILKLDAQYVVFEAFNKTKHLKTDRPIKNFL